VATYGNVSWNDKPVLTTSADGRHVYVSWNGPQGGDPWMAVSHDRGATWTQTEAVDSDRYYFAFDATVLPDGTVVFSESSLTYTGPGGDPEGVVIQHALISTDQGRTWRDVAVDTVPVGEPCADCRADYYLGHPSVSSNASGALVFAYDGAREPFGPQRIFVRGSSDGGATWSARTPLSVAGENASAPMLEFAGGRDVRSRTSRLRAATTWTAGLCGSGRRVTGGSPGPRR
jgi:Neuraminidase (sialidase)